MAVSLHNAGGGAATVKQWLKARCTPATLLRLSKAAGLADRLLLNWWRPNLNRLALIYGTDKWGLHWYTQHYQRYFKPLRLRRLNVLEIGVGGYDVPSEGARSLRMWKAYFPKSRIVGIDIEDKTAWRERRIDIRQCDQTDADALKKLSEEYGGFDIIIDDGSHINQHVIATFEVLFPLLRPNGIYAVEDTQTACWPTWGGGVQNPANSIAYFKRLVDGLNYAEYPIPGYRPTYFDENIVEISFFHNLVIIRKGRNDELSNCSPLIEKELESMAAARETVASSAQ
jgi:hypothetical protein